MKLSYLALSWVALGLCSTAFAQVQSSRPTTTPAKAQAGVKQAPPVKQPLYKPGSVKAQPAQQHVVPSQQNGTALLVGGGDNCAAPDLISGAGPFSVNTTAATTGAEGQAEGICLFFGQVGITNDVWFNWTSGVTGTVTLSMCAGTTGIDPKVAIYNGTGCPTSGTAIACNDDFCGLVSQVSWTAVSGQSYVIQMGNFPGALSYNSSFTVMAPPPGPPNDNCSGATPISGFGNFPIDTTGATGSIANGTCAQPNNDVWFAWTATTTGPTQISFCGLTSTDTVAAVWNSGSCPPTTLVACNDDFCGLQTQLTFAAVSGTTYLFELGAFGTTTTYIATFNVQAGPPPPPGDDCATPASVTPGAGPYPFDTTAATTSPQGQAEPLCLFFSSTTIAHDIWVTWGPAPSSGPFRALTCGLTTVDTKVAIYDGAGCPAAAAIACNDDDCGLQSGVVFNAVAGQTYTVQLGTFPTANGGTGSFDIVPFVPPAGDDCATPAAITPGAGPYAFDNSIATTSPQGQAEPLCLFFSSTTIDRDLWHTWGPAPSSGPFRAFSCGQTGVDTKIAIYDGAGCPAASAIACNDDDCAFQSGVVFNAVAGQTYTVQLGTFPGATGGTGTFDIVPFVPPPGDDCASPVALVGAGPFAYDNSLATTGTQGQSEPLCLFFSSTTIDHDVWYCWTAPSSGSFDVTTIGLTFDDTKIAVYDGCGCPVTAALACNDDSCGTLQSTATFNAVGGNTYTLQIGNFPGASGGPSAFDIVPTPVSGSGCQYDDGSSENSIGLTAGGQLLWIQPFGSIGGQTLVSSVSAAYGTPLFPGGTPPVGTPVDVCVYDDPNDDGDPSDAVLVSQTPGVVGNVDNDILDTYAVPPAVLNGRFFVGVAITHAAGQFPAALDGGFCGAAQAWAIGSTAGPLDFNVLTNNNVPPTNITAIFGGIWMVRAGCSNSGATSFCGNGDPNRIPCPCGNNGTNPNAGCANSLNAAGALMTATGFPSTDDVVLNGTGMSGTICIFIRTLGPQQTNGAVFGDGITCTGGPLLRLRAVSFAGGIGGTASFPVPPETITLSARSGTFPGSGATMQYSGFYRNAAAAFCPPFTFNTHNTLELTW